jgi:tetratricopeptide (TPR) repeat protein
MAKKDKQPLLTGKRRKVIIITGVIVLVLIAAGAGIAIRWWQDTRQQPDSSQVDEEELPTLPPVVDDLQNLRNEGNGEKFDQELATALENPDYDDPTRALLYIQQGNAAYDAKDFNAALESYLQAEVLDQSSQTAQLVGFAYQELGNKAKAIEYYQLTIERFSPDNVLYDAEKSYFEDRINQLRS